MRDILISIIIAAALIRTLKKPHEGVLLWAWLGYMNPHRLCYGFAQNMPYNQITALVALVSVLFSKERKSLPNDFLIILLVIFVAWMGITTAFAFEPTEASEQYTKILKVLMPVFLTMLMFNTKQRIEQLLWIIVISLGYFGVKGGIFTVMTGGSYRVYGPPTSYVEENNTLAVAILMIMPLLVYLRGQMTKKLYKQIALFCILSMGCSVLGSQSRGAFLAISVVGGYFWLQSNRKMASALALVIFAATVAALLPESWYERMNSIENYQQDESSMGRIRAWTMAFNVANHNILGGGLGLWSPATYLAYLENYQLGMPSFVAHSIYFSVLGEHGWIGLSLYLLLFWLAWLRCGTVIKLSREQEDMKWMGDLAKMIRISMLAFLSGGAFLSIAYFDLPWHLIALVILLKEIAQKSKIPEEAREPLLSKRNS